MSSQVCEVLQQAALWSLRTRVDVEILCVDDGPNVYNHATLHGYSLAIDVDSVGDKPNDTEELAEWMRRVLPPQFDVVFEGDHIHIEWDSHRAVLRRLAT